MPSLHNSDRVMKDQLKDDYKNFTLNENSEMPVKQSCLEFLEQHSIMECFCILPIHAILSDILERMEKNSVKGLQLIAKILRIFEKYAVGILKRPWCKEFHTIKEYTGFFKYNIGQWLSNSVIYNIFKLIGYDKSSSAGILKLGKVDKSQVLCVGFELYLAHTQVDSFSQNEQLTSIFSTKNIIEGWINTNASISKILNWLDKTLKVETDVSNDAVLATGNNRDLNSGKQFEGKPERFEESIAGSKHSHQLCDQNCHSLPCTSAYHEDFDKMYVKDPSYFFLLPADYPDEILYGASSPVSSELSQNHERYRFKISNNSPNERGKNSVIFGSKHAVNRTENFMFDRNLDLRGPGVEYGNMRSLNNYEMYNSKSEDEGCDEIMYQNADNRPENGTYVTFVPNESGMSLKLEGIRCDRILKNRIKQTESHCASIEEN